MRYIPLQARSSQRDHSNDSWRVQIIQLLILQFPPLPLPHPCYAKIFSSAPYSHTPSGYFPLSV
jgi:hypothetical protein